MKDINGLNIGFALTGSYCTFSQTIPQVKKLVELGANVFPIMSENASSTDTRFGMSAEFLEMLTQLCSKPVIKSIKDAEPIGPKNFLDALIIAPCTGNTLGKLALGITDTCVTMAYKAILRNNKPVVIGISTNDGLSASGKSIGNLLNTKKIYFVPFGQDDPIGKTTSLVAHMDLVIPTLELALSGVQIQPLLK